jgi:hypothetical protein
MTTSRRPLDPGQRVRGYRLETSQRVKQLNEEARMRKFIGPARQPKPGLVIALVVSGLLTGHEANAANGCGAGLYRDSNGRCHFYRAPALHVNQQCQVGYIWRNGHCRQNIGNDPFVSTWPNAPR